ncbi:FG-GAP-like repeat-containing protein [Actinopolyspora mortivallis]|uniref:FG-GAP-like repeat-containing protein n=1 Tax=Actinopolyspora mortivallis TaxID=33906 RepID=UPI0015E626C2|nr:FG-GAP-like repeat-containing protein [Actinopolyspora mortivallis]
MRSRRAAGIAATAVAATALCGLPAQAISGGQPVPDGSYGFLAKVDVGDQRSCSGALVAQQWLVTAASCFAEDPANPGSVPAGEPTTPTTATVGGGDVSGSSGHTVDVVDLVPRTDRNLVLAKLGSAVDGVTPVSLSETAASQGDTFRSAGYGRTATEWTPNTPHTGTFSVEAVGDTSLNVLGTSEQDSICKGDAGGPVLRQVNERVELVGVNSASWQHGCFGEDTTKRGATIARTDDLVGWVNSGMLDLTATPASKHAINLSWKPSNAEKYRIYAATTPEVPLTDSALVGTTSNHTYRHEALRASRTWHYRVAPVTASGQQQTATHTVTATTTPEAGTDFNGDGYEDIATFEKGNFSVSDSDGVSFSAEKSWNTSLIEETDTQLSGDFNGDGRSDVALFKQGESGGVYVALGGESGFGAFRLWHGYFAPQGERPAVGDFNGDGKDDIVTFLGNDATNNGDVYVSLSTGDAFIEDDDKWHDYFGLDDERPAVGDFNGDGKDDIITFLGNDTNNPNDVYVSLSTGSAFVEDNDKWHDYFGLENERPAVGDFNGDGKDDIITFMNDGEGGAYVALSAGDTFNTGSRWHDYFAPDGELPAVGDFNGDGKDDIITFRTDEEGRVYVSRSTGDTFVEDDDLWGTGVCPQSELSWKQCNALPASSL